MRSLAELLRDVRALELTARRSVAGVLAGEYAARVRGRGMTFAEARKYVPGDDVRLIDWNMTARARETYVRVNLEEREREVFLALDISPSMRTGFQEKTKLDFAVELAATLAVSAEDHRDRLGFLFFDAEVRAFSPPGRGKRNLFRTLREMLNASEGPGNACRESDPRAAIHAIQQMRGKRFVVFLISDFIDHDVPDDLRYVQARHDVSLLHVYDPFEYAQAPPVRFPACSPEGRRRTGTARPGGAGALSETQAFLRSAAQTYGLRWGSFSVTEPAGRALGRFFHARRPARP